MRPPVAPRRGRPQERGQLFAGYIIGILLMSALLVYVFKNTQYQRKSVNNDTYRSLALEVAKAGFEDGLSYFRRQPDGVYLDAYPADCPTSRNWTTPWPKGWPDAAFLPKNNDTDFFSQITASMPAGSSLTSTGAAASAIIRTVPLNYFGVTLTASENASSNLWGRYVLRRQNTRNWSPGQNTFAAYTDPEAVHDLTHIRSDTKPGSGNYWSIFSRSYIFNYPSNISVAAAHEGNCLLSPPKRFYNGKRLLLATASVYGELSRINFNQPAAAIFVPVADNITCYSNGVINGQGYSAAAQKASGSITVSGGTVNGGTYTTGSDPTVSYCFPGQDSASLKSMAQSYDYTKVGGIECFPRSTDSNFADIVSRTSFYYITTTGLAGGTLVFGANDTRVMSGVGLVFIDGNLTIEAKNQSAWAGVVYVNGNVYIRGPAEISGTLIATGTVKVGNSADINKAFIEYNPDAVDTVQTYLQQFHVVTSSIVAKAQ